MTFIGLSEGGCHFNRLSPLAEAVDKRAPPSPASGDHFSVLLHLVAMRETKTNRKAMITSEDFFPCLEKNT